MLRLTLIVACCLTAAGLPAVNPAQADEAGEVIYPKAYDGFQASRDAQEYWDTRRRDAVNRQLGWNEFFKWRTAASQSQTFYYDPYIPSPLAYPRGHYYGDLYSSWPYSIGRLTGYGYYNPVPQPIGRRQVQTGPNRWESFPVYAHEVDAPQDEQILPSPRSPLRPDIAPPRAAVPPVPRGREF